MPLVQIEVSRRYPSFWCGEWQQRVRKPPPNWRCRMAEFSLYRVFAPHRPTPADGRQELAANGSFTASQLRMRSQETVGVPRIRSPSLRTEQAQVQRRPNSRASRTTGFGLPPFAARESTCESPMGLNRSNRPSAMRRVCQACDGPGPYWFDAHRVQPGHNGRCNWRAAATLSVRNTAHECRHSPSYRAATRACR